MSAQCVLTMMPPWMVIIGAGSAGLAVAKGLAPAPVDVTIVDRRNYHLFQPLLCRAAAATLLRADIPAPIRAIVEHQADTTVRLGLVEGIDKTAQLVVVRGQPSLPYDFLVVATGAEHDRFGSARREAFAPALKKIDDAKAIRRPILMTFAPAETGPVRSSGGASPRWSSRVAGPPDSRRPGRSRRSRGVLS
jgi:NADH:ubiquinone reductase (H+-translocating)